MRCYGFVADLKKKLRKSRCFCLDFNSFGVSLVGFQGQNSLFSYGGDLDEAKSVFRKKYVEQKDYNIAMHMATVQHIPRMKAIPLDDIRQMNVFFFAGLVKRPGINGRTKTVLQKLRENTTSLSSITMLR